MATYGMTISLNGATLLAHVAWWHDVENTLGATNTSMLHVLLEGYTVDEILQLPNEELKAVVLRDEPLVFKAGSANMLGSFKVSTDTLYMELAHVDGGGEGALPSLASLASRYAKREDLAFIERRVHAVHCARPNLKLRRVLVRRGFTVREVEGVVRPLGASSKRALSTVRVKSCHIWHGHFRQRCPFVATSGKVA